jgi:hypothetical protein
MSLPDIDWTVGWAEQLAADRKTDWPSDYELGYQDALIKLVQKFEQEYSETAGEDPHFAFYSRYVLDILNEELNRIKD